MSIEGIAAIAANDIAPLVAASTQAATGPLAPQGVNAAATVFETMLETLDGLNTRMLQSRQATESIALGNLDNLHHVMMNAEQTRLTFDLVLQVRNKVLDAYQELMRMQV
jgi:flagellar hook-basal body complex protein FliE